MLRYLLIYHEISFILMLYLTSKYSFIGSNRDIIIHRYHYLTIHRSKARKSRENNYYDNLLSLNIHKYGYYKYINI